MGRLGATAVPAFGPRAQASIDIKSAASKGLLPTKGGWASAPSANPPAGSGAPGAPPPPPGTPVGGPGSTTALGVGTPSWLQQWQTQQNYQQTTVSTPVQVVTQPQLSVMFTPPQPSGDLGPMGFLDEAFGRNASASTKCLTWALVGAALAYFSKRGG